MAYFVQYTMTGPDARVRTETGVTLATLRRLVACLEIRIITVTLMLD